MNLTKVAKRVAARYLKLASVQPEWTDPGTGTAQYKINERVNLVHHNGESVVVSGAYKDVIAMVPLLKENRFKWNPGEGAWIKPMKRVSDVHRLILNLREVAKDVKNIDYDVPVPKLSFKLDEWDINTLSKSIGAIGKPRWVKTPQGWTLRFLIREPVNSSEADNLGREVSDWTEELVSRDKAKAPVVTKEPSAPASSGPSDKQIQMLMKISEEDWFDLVDGAVDQSVFALRRISKQYASELISEYLESRNRHRGGYPRRRY
jgi:hypothetical protein